MTEEGPPAADPIVEGVRLFNEGHFFEAHEVLEEAWYVERGEPRLFLQGLIQICAGFHHFQNGNLRGATALLARGTEKMERYPGEYLGIDASRLLADIRAFQGGIQPGIAGPSDARPVEIPHIRSAPRRGISEPSA